MPHFSRHGPGVIFDRYSFIPANLCSTVCSASVFINSIPFCIPEFHGYSKTSVSGSELHRLGEFERATESWDLDDAASVISTSSLPTCGCGCSEHLLTTTSAGILHSSRSKPSPTPSLPSDTSSLTPICFGRSVSLSTPP